MEQKVGKENNVQKFGDLYKKSKTQNRTEKVETDELLIKYANAIVNLKEVDENNKFYSFYKRYADAGIEIDENGNKLGIKFDNVGKEFVDGNKINEIQKENNEKGVNLEINHLKDIDKVEIVNFDEENTFVFFTNENNGTKRDEKGILKINDVDVFEIDCKYCYESGNNEIDKYVNVGMIIFKTKDIKIIEEAKKCKFVGKLREFLNKLGNKLYLNY